MLKKSFGEKGSMLVEAALVTPLMLILLAGIIQFGFILNAKIAVNAASYEAARTATLSQDPVSKAIEAAQGYASGTLPGWSTDERLRVDVILSGTDPYDMVKVNVDYSVPVFFSNIIQLEDDPGSGQIRVTGTSSMRIEEKS